MEIKAKDIRLVDEKEINSDQSLPSIKRKPRQYDIDRRSNLLNKMINSKFGRLTVVSFLRSDRCHTYWECICDCGSKRINTKNSLTRGMVISCGCHKDEIFKKSITKHGKSKTKIYKVWHAIMQRCFNKNCDAYINYGGRGISVSDDWKDFEIFFDEFGKFAEKGKSIDRINNELGYSIENCRWATPAEQNVNKRTTAYYKKNGITKPVIIWAKEMGVAKNKAYAMASKGSL